MVRNHAKLIGAIIVVIIVVASCLGILITLIDGLTTQYVETIDSPCVDKNGDKFQDELCDKKVYCTWLGLFGDAIKCSDRLDAEAVEGEGK